MLNQLMQRPPLVALAAFGAVLLLAFIYITINSSGDGGPAFVSNAPAQTSTAMPAATAGATPTPDATVVPTPTPSPGALPEATIVYGTPPPHQPAPDRPPPASPTPFPNPTTIDTDGDGEPDTDANLHECVAAGNCDCDDFETFEEALASLYALPDDPFKLDPDNDGFPCQQADYAPR